MQINNQYISPNYSIRQSPVDMIILHYTQMDCAMSAIKRLCDPIAKVSSHYLIAKDGEVFRLVDDSYVAWHAGRSYWQGRDQINQYSLGIEIDNNGQEEFSEAIYTSLLKLLDYLTNLHNISSSSIIGHSDIAPRRKQDPGYLFDWQLLAQHGYGLVASAIDIKANNDLAELKKYLGMIGYETDDMNKTIEAFNSHFMQHIKDGSWDKQTIILAAQIANNLL